MKKSHLGKTFVTGGNGQSKKYFCIKTDFPEKFYSRCICYKREPSLPVVPFQAPGVNSKPDNACKIEQRPEQEAFVDFVSCRGKEKQIKHLEQNATGCLVCTLRQIWLRLGRVCLTPPSAGCLVMSYG